MNPSVNGADLFLLLSALLLSMCGIAWVGFARLDRRREGPWLPAFLYLRAGIATITLIATDSPMPHPAWYLAASILDIAAGMCIVEYARRSIESAGHAAGRWIHFFVLAAALPFAYSLRLDPLWTTGALATLVGTATTAYISYRKFRNADWLSSDGLQRHFHLALGVYGLAGICFPVLRHGPDATSEPLAPEILLPALATLAISVVSGAVYWQHQYLARRTQERREWVMRNIAALALVVGVMILGIVISEWVPRAHLGSQLVSLLVTLLVLTSFHAQERVREQMVQIAHSDRRSAALIESTPNAVQLCDRQGKLLVVNRAWRMAYGVREHDLGTTRFIDLWPEPARGMIAEAVSTTLNGTPSRFEAEYVHPDGRTLLFSVVTNPVPDEDGHVTSYVAISADITARRKSELALIAAKNAAEAATQAKDEFLAVMGHEIRTPLGGVIGLLDALKRMPQPPSQRRHTELAIDSAEALLETLDHILDAARLDAGKFALEPAPFNPVTEFTRVLEGQRVRAEASNLALKVHMAPDLPTSLVGDATRLRQVLVNLVTNAIKFTRKGHVSVSVAGEPRPGLQYLLRIQVADTGIGIRTEMQERLLGRAETTSGARQAGIAGLGLTIVRSIVDLMSGNLRVISEPGKGSAFTVELTLPLGPSLSDRASPVLAPAVSSTRPPIPIPGAVAAPAPTTAVSPEVGNLKILCAEDNATNRLIIQLMLESLGHTVAFAEDGQEAVERLSRDVFDLVLMDNRMPVMDGFQATRIIRDPASTVLAHDVPVIALTANASKNYKDQCLASGMNDYLTKPVREAALRSALAKAMNGRPRVITVEGRTPTAPPLQLDRTSNVPPPASVSPRQTDADTSPSDPDQAPETGAEAPQPEITGMSEEELMALLDEAEQEPDQPDPSAALSPEARRKISLQYLNETPRLLNQLRVAWLRQDGPTLARAGHSLKSSSRYVKATRLSEIGKQIEKLADEGSFAQISALLSETDREFELVNERLQMDNYS
ncbi:MAG: response regulator [Opitutaceae bacterium]|nr:response regulator [Opitutaceae bacterium]